MTSTSSEPRSAGRSRRSSRNARSASDPSKRKPEGRIRWRRIPGRLILIVCYSMAAVALGAAIIPFTSSVDGVDLNCGPAVFEVLMPPDPVFDDIPENARCAELAKTRLIVAGSVLAGTLFIAAITERRTRRGSQRRDATWLATSASTKRRKRQSRSRRRRGGSAPELDPATNRSDAAALPPSRP